MLLLDDVFNLHYSIVSLRIMAEYRPLFSHDTDRDGFGNNSGPFGCQIVQGQSLLEQYDANPVAARVREIRKHWPEDALRAVYTPDSVDLPKYFHRNEVRRYGKLCWTEIILNYTDYQQVRASYFKC